MENGVAIYSLRFGFVVLEMEPMASNMLSKCFTLRHTPASLPLEDTIGSYTDFCR